MYKIVFFVTNKSMTHLIYSDHHRVHSEGAYLFSESAELIANERIAKQLTIVKDPKRAVPDTT